MNLHRFLDVLGMMNMWRYPWPPVESTVAGLHELLETSERERHPDVAPARLAFEREQEAKGCREVTFTFPSPRPSGRAELDRAIGVLWPAGRAGEGDDGPRPRAALVMAHGGFARGQRRVRWFLPPPGSASWDTYSLELPHHMRRQRAESLYSGQYMVSGDVVRLVRGMLQAEADVRALVLGLRELGYRRVVLGGISLGGNAALQAALRVPLEGLFALAPAVDASASLWQTVLAAAVRPAGRAAGFTDELVRAALRLITPAHRGRPVFPAGRILFIYGENDLLCPPGPIEELMRAWPGCRRRPLETGHATLILRWWTVRRIVAAWIPVTQL
jgi:pimeloyl-ACP methyl ester carboxylesterase